MTYYPIIIPTLNRYEKLKACIDSLAQCEEAKYTELVIGLDYPPADKYIDGWKKISEYIETIKGFAKITCIRQSENIGAIKNSQLLEHYALEKYDAYIYSEDDNVFSPYFLRFINEGLDKYKEDNSVIAVCGYSYPIDWKTEKDCVLQHQYFSAWGFGIWKNRYNQLYSDIPSSDFRDSVLNKHKRKDLKKSKKNFFAAQGFIFDNNIYPCDVTISAYLYLNKKNVLMPVVSLSRNIGWDGSGEHCLKDDKHFSEQIINMTKELNVEPEIINYSRNLEIFQTSLVKKWKLKIVRVYCLNLLLRIIGKSNAYRIRKLRNKLLKK